MKNQVRMNKMKCNMNVNAKMKESKLLPWYKILLKMKRRKINTSTCIICNKMDC